MRHKHIVTVWYSLVFLYHENMHSVNCTATQTMVKPCEKRAVSATNSPQTKWVMLSDPLTSFVLLLSQRLALHLQSVFP